MNLTQIALQNTPQVDLSQAPKDRGNSKTWALN